MTETIATFDTAIDVARGACERLLDRQRTAFAAGPPDYRARMRALAALRDAIRAREGEIEAAVSSDFGGRSRDETRLLEMVPLIDGIRHSRAALAGWMEPRKVGSTWFLWPSTAYTIHQPKGVIGVMGAWNYPLLLTLGPLVNAIAAGNHVVVKPSELTPATAAVLEDLLTSTFPSEYVTAITGGIEMSQAFATLPWDHLVFTGSSRVGRLVMRAAAANLTPVTLELGGKSPVIIHQSYPIEVALRRILVGNLFNAGQTCIAPDYVLAPRLRLEEIATLSRTIVGELYPRLVDNPDYSRILNDTLYRRLEDMVDGAERAGARVLRLNPAGEHCSSENRIFPPTLVFDPPLDARIMTEEIFGPVLPIIAYDALDDAIAFVNARPRPLALYYFDNDHDRIEHVIHATTSGGVTINDTLLHIAQHNLPFGGTGESGIGHYHGFDGFEEFSVKKSVMIQGRWSPTTLLGPPFSDRKRRLLRRLMRLAHG